MTWSSTSGHEYLLRSAYDNSGKRRQKSLGPRSAATEELKAQFEAARSKAERQAKDLEAAMQRQSSVNRALRLGRMPLEAARILRALDAAGLLGGKLRVLGSNALYAYEAVAGVHLEAEYMETGDFDFLLDARANLSFSGEDASDDPSLIRILQRVDKSFERTSNMFRAVNRNGYLVDLIKPLREPPWRRTEIGSAPTRKI